jgi:uroporphyrinogen III methyltransferase/synthase
VRVVVTRPVDQAEQLASRLRLAGHEVVLCPLVQVVPLGDGGIDTSGYDWVVVTSPNGAMELARRRWGTLAKVAAVGPGTATVLREHGVEPDLVPRVSTQEGLLEELPRPAGRVLFAGAEGARRVLVEELEADFVPLYRTIELEPEVQLSGDVVVLASASAARAFGRLHLDLPVVSIGPQTTAAAREAGVNVAAEALTHDLDGLVEAVARLAR